MQKRIKINIGDKTYNCLIAETEEQRKQGLSNVEYLAPDEGMLFIWDEEGTREMWMKDCSIPLDQIGINEDDEVVMVYTAQPNDETLIPFPNCKYILEVNQNSGIKEGDEFEIDEDDDLNKYVMKILAPDGSTQMHLQGEERIFSRKFTKSLLIQIIKAKRVQNDELAFERKCKRIGKMTFKEINAQDNREPEYVTHN